MAFIPKSVSDKIRNLFYKLDPALFPAIDSTLQILEDAPADDPILMFVDQAGLDSNPGTEESPFETLDRAMMEFNANWGGKARIKLSAGVHQVEGAKRYITGAPRGDGEPLLIYGTGWTEIISGDITGSTDTTVSTGIGMVLDEHRKKYLVIKSGDLNGTRFQITRNTVAGVITINGDWLGGLVGNEAFAIETPATTIEYDSAIHWDVESMTQYSLRWEKVAGASPAIGLFTVSKNATARFIGVDFELASFAFPLLPGLLVALEGAVMGSTFEDDFHPDVFVGFLEGSAGMSVTGGIGWNAFHRAELSGAVIADGTAISIVDGARTEFFPLDADDSNVSGSGNSNLNFFAFGAKKSIIEGGFGLVIARGSTCDLGEMDINNSVGNGLELLSGSIAILFNTDGAGNAGHGISVGEGSSVFTQGDAPLPTGTNCSLTGAGGDIKVGATTKTYAEIDAALFLEDKNLAQRI